VHNLFHNLTHFKAVYLFLKVCSCMSCFLMAASVVVHWWCFEKRE